MKIGIEFSIPYNTVYVAYFEQHKGVYDFEFFGEHLMLAQRKLAILGTTALTRKQIFSTYYVLLSLNKSVGFVDLNFPQKADIVLNSIVLLEPE